MDTEIWFYLGIEFLVCRRRVAHCGINPLWHALKMAYEWSPVLANEKARNVVVTANSWKCRLLQRVWQGSDEKIDGN